MFTFRCKSLFPGYKESFQRRDTKAKPGPGPCGLHALQQCFHLLLLLLLHHTAYRLHTYLHLLLLHVAHMLHLLLVGNRFEREVCFYETVGNKE